MEGLPRHRKVALGAEVGHPRGPGRRRRGGPKALDMLFTTAMLEGDFAELEVQLCVTEEAVLDEGPYHQGRAELTRLVARRPL